MLDPPSSLSTDTPRIEPVEFTTYRVRAKLVGAVVEDDHDIHLVIRAPTSRRKTMIVEFPSVRCNGAKDSKKRAAMKRARAALTNACGGHRDELRRPPGTGEGHRSGVLGRDSRTDGRGPKRDRASPGAQVQGGVQEGLTVSRSRTGHRLSRCRHPPCGHRETSARPCPRRCSRRTLRTPSTGVSVVACPPAVAAPSRAQKLRDYPE